MNIDDLIQNARDAGTWLAQRHAARKITEIYTAGAETPRHKIKVAFLSSFTIEFLVDYVIVAAAEQGIWLQPYLAPYQQFNQEILDPKSGLYNFTPELTFLFTEWQSLTTQTSQTMPHHSPDKMIAPLVSLTKTFHNHSASPLILNTFIAAPSWPLHIMPDEKTEFLRRANRCLWETFTADPQTQICDLDSLAAYGGYRQAFSPEMKHLAQNPFSETFMTLLAKKIMSHIRACLGQISKCLVLDCDHTLWGGIIGEDGLDGIQLGPDVPGREFVDFQQTILELYHQGVILALNSKNNDHDVMEVLHKHPHMVLRENNFAALQINWNEKPANMLRIADELNIGLDSLVFLDDNPSERAMMRQMRPEICTLELPDNPAFFSRTLRETNLFAHAYLTTEDRQRGSIYAAQRQRQQLKTSVASLEEFLKSLEMVVTIRRAQSTDLKRAVQLIRRTNQFNLTTRRYNEAEVKSMLTADDWRVYVLDLQDKFGDNGAVGLALVARENERWRIDTFLMSCRVIGRTVEDALVDRILQDAAAENIPSVQGEYLPSTKNSLVADFWEKMNFNARKTGANQPTWFFDVTQFHPKTFPWLKILNR